MSSQTLQILILAILVSSTFIDTLLDILNLNYKQSSLPEELKDIYTQEQFIKSQSYLKDKTYYSVITGVFSLCVTLTAIYSGLLGDIETWTKSLTSIEVLQPILLFGVLFLASDLINIPFTLYNNFVIEEKYGFNKMTVKTFITDKLKSYALMSLFGSILFYALFSLIIFLGADFWIWFWIVISVFILSFTFLYSSVFLPLFNKLTPMEDGEIKSEIDAYSKKVDFPVQQVMVMDGSKRSSKANAFFSGFGKKKKIVLFDTLIEKLTKEELVSVLAHEAGHYKKKHIITGMVLSLTQMGLILFILSRFIFNDTLSTAMGGTGLSYGLNLIAFTIIFSPFSTVIGLFMNLFSRKNEYEADRYAADTYNGEALISSLKKLTESNLSNLTPHPLYVAVHYSHPTLLQRIQKLRKK